jgi:hypothetical protein
MAIQQWPLNFEIQQSRSKKLPHCSCSGAIQGGCAGVTSGIEKSAANAVTFRVEGMRMMGSSYLSRRDPGPALRKGAKGVATRLSASARGVGYPSLPGSIGDLSRPRKPRVDVHPESPPACHQKRFFRGNISRSCPSLAPTHPLKIRPSASLRGLRSR